MPETHAVSLLCSAGAAVQCVLPSTAMWTARLCSRCCILQALLCKVSPDHIFLDAQLHAQLCYAGVWQLLGPHFFYIQAAEERYQQGMECGEAGPAGRHLADLGVTMLQLLTARYGNGRWPRPAHSVGIHRSAQGWGTGLVATMQPLPNTRRAHRCPMQALQLPDRAVRSKPTAKTHLVLSRLPPLVLLG